MLLKFRSCWSLKGFVKLRDRAGAELRGYSPISVRKLSTTSHIVLQAHYLLVDMSAQLTALASLISQGVEDINKVYAAHNKEFPSLSDANAPSVVLDNAALIFKTNIVLGAAAQLIDA